MGNLFSWIDESSPSSAPSGKYTITPTEEKKTTSKKDDKDDDEKCENGTKTTSSPSETKEVEVNYEDDAYCLGVNARKALFNATTYTVIFWVIVAYILYLLFKAIYKNKGAINESSGKTTYSRTIDLILLFLLISICFGGYYSLDENDKKNIFGYTIQWTQDYFGSTWGLFELVWFTIIFFALVYILRVPMTPGLKPVLVEIVEKKIWIVYLMFGIVLFFKYLLDIPILKLLFDNKVTNYFKDVKPYDAPSHSPQCDTWFDDDDDDDNKSPSTEVCITDNQVFNVGNNLYTYEEAQKVCAAFDASLATYDQVENAYNAGAEWCNYGWSDGQMAFFPTQKDTWDKLQENPNTKQICGRPGVNGGYMKNPYIRFGANCYGIKPDEPDNWVSTSYVTDCGVNKEDPNEKIRESARLNSFNTKQWSRY